MKAKTLILTLFFSLLLMKGFSQSSSTTAAGSPYAIIQVISPQTVMGEYEIRIYYGDNKVELYKKVEYSRKDRDMLSTEIVNALNYMAAKGYNLTLTNTYTLPNPDIQYILRK